MPRCTDPESSVRDLAVDCLGLILETISKYLGYSPDYEKTSIVKLEALKNDLGATDPTAALNGLADLLNVKTPTSDLWSFLESAASGLNDPFASSSSGVSFVICLILKVRKRLSLSHYNSHLQKFIHLNCIFRLEEAKFICESKIFWTFFYHV